MKKFLKIISIIIGIIIFLWVIILISGTRILISELREELAKTNELLLICDYFTGTGITTKVLLYTEGNFSDKSGCLFLD